MNSKKPEETPPYSCSIRDPHYDRIYFVFSYEPLVSREVIWSKVSQFLGGRKRRMPVNHENLPKAVKLLVREDGKVIPLDLPTQRELEAEQRSQNRQKKRLETFLRETRKRNAKRRPGTHK